MTPLVQNVTTLIALGVIALDAIIVLGFGLLLLEGRKLKGGLRRLMDSVADNAFVLGLLIVVAGAFASLFYSMVAEFEPCTLCWWQRVLLFPQAAIFGAALYAKRKGDGMRTALLSSAVLSAAGALIAAYQYYAQMWNVGLLSACGAAGASCAQIFFVAFGYITIPMMALSGFLALVLIALVASTYKR